MVRNSYNTPRMRVSHRATSAVQYAIRKGKITRQPCEVCGHIDSQAHHTSYEIEKWLCVTWLCRLHHIEWHSRNTPIYPAALS